MLTKIHLENDRVIFGNQFDEPIAETEKIDRSPAKGVPTVSLPKQGRNELCPCNSGKKYKKCCGTSDNNAS
jgi:uncharacterized protein YecA (UPF0149 family)